MALDQIEPEEVLVVEGLNEDRPQSLWQLSKATLRILIPTDISNLLWMSSQTVTLIFVSRNHGALGTAQYSAGLTIFNMLGFSFVQGFGSAIDTIASQAYGKNRKSPEVGEILQMALAFDMVLGIFIALFFMNCKGLACWLLGEEIGVGTAEFLAWCPPYLFVQIVSGLMSKSMFAQKCPGIVAMANLTAACSSPVANYFLTPRGLHGAALSLFITVGLCSLTHVICCIYHPRVIVREAQWPTKQLLSLGAWKRFFRIGVPSLVATCAEWWAFEVQMVLAAQLGPLPLAIHGVCMNLVQLLFSVALGICVSASVIVGNSLGANRPVQAKQFAYFIIACDLVIGTITAFFMLLFGHDIARVFADADSKDYHAIVDGVKEMMVFVVLCHMGDSLQFCLQGVFRGAGRPKEVGIVVLATLWLVGVPASCFFVLYMKTGVSGCIGGLLVGFVFEIPALFFWMTRFDWDKLALKAQEQITDDPAVELAQIAVAAHQPASSEDSVADKKPGLGDGGCFGRGGWREGIIDYPNELCNEQLSPVEAVANRAEPQSGSTCGGSGTYRPL